MIIIKLDDIKITKINKDGSFSPHPLTKSSYYKSLMQANDKEYKKYHKKLEKYHYKKSIDETTELSYNEFLYLKFSIQHMGFKILDPKIKINEDLEVLDGQHRLSILKYLYDDLLLEINENGEVIKIWRKLGND